MDHDHTHDGGHGDMATGGHEYVFMSPVYSFIY